MNIIILIIASDAAPKYIAMQKLWKKYMNSYPNIKSYFIKNKQELDQDLVVNENENTIYVKGEESIIPGILHKTIKVFEYCAQHMQFDFMYRTNLSSFIDLDKAYKYIQNNGHNFNYAGCGIYYYWNNPICASGCGFILSKKGLNTLLYLKHLLNYNENDDVAIGHVLIKIYDIYDIKRYDVVNVNDKIFSQETTTNIFHFRCKSDKNNNNTNTLLEKIYDKIMGIRMYTMKLTTVLGSVNNNPAYYKFIPKQIIFWGHFGIRFMAVFAGESIPGELLEYKDNIILWNRNTHLNSVFLGQTLRMYYTALLKLPDDELVMITDMDMLPTKAKYYTEGLENFTKEDFIYYRFIHGDQIFMCYNAAHPDTWAKAFGVYSEDDIERELNNNCKSDYNGIHGMINNSVGWFTDQEIMCKKLLYNPHLRVLNRNIKRLEMNDYRQRLRNGETNFVSEYDDVHFHTNFFNNEDLILDAEKQLLL